MQAKRRVYHLQLGGAQKAAATVGGSKVTKKKAKDEKADLATEQPKSAPVWLFLTRMGALRRLLHGTLNTMWWTRWGMQTLSTKENSCDGTVP